MFVSKGRFGLGAVLCAATIASAAPASAAIVTFSNITGTWYDAVLLAPGTPTEAYSGNGTANAQVRWGVDTGQGRSGYNFTAPGSVSFFVPTNGSSGYYNVGGFEHVNFPVQPPSISSIKLSYTANVDVDGTVLFPADWTKRRTEMLPSDSDRDFIESLMQPETEPGQFASWIAPPKVGIDNKPGNFEYVKIA